MQFQKSLELKKAEWDKVSELARENNKVDRRQNIFFDSLTEKIINKNAARIIGEISLETKDQKVRDQSKADLLNRF